MATYVMSDIHGCYSEFQMMLEQIRFLEEDYLILAGDYIDRGPNSYGMLRWLENPPDNVLIIRGNHENFFAGCVSSILGFIDKYDIDKELLLRYELQKVYNLTKEEIDSSYFDYYGTIEELIINHDLHISDFEKWFNIIMNMPYVAKIRIDDRNHIIVHAGYITERKFKQARDEYHAIEYFYTGAREDALKYGGERDSIIVAGHTPTIIEGVFYTGGNIFKYYDAKNNVEFYNIDCGAAYKYGGYNNAKLACLRLEDKKEFYI